ncbi:hypothetical protein POX_d05141 [Penicillium oxalicum]|uniref:hypothetical protein n=1 Tax=Penicillium oxalicum TaxID=69781 RepID=UPI0020B82500|nr:hypothetical protein POX_d05141 [Penicillium oxalicum]KAI2789646.1 hypothetical protein POX_d05141 [Penicillium oxalicum]
MFGIQFDAAGIYLVGTPTHQFHISFEELMSSTGGIIALLEYGLTCKVIHAVLSRIRHRVWHQARRNHTLDEPATIWIDNSGPATYEVRHGLESIRVTPQELESSRFGMAIKKNWDEGMAEPSNASADKGEDEENQRALRIMMISGLAPSSEADARANDGSMESIVYRAVLCGWKTRAAILTTGMSLSRNQTN